MATSKYVYPLGEDYKQLVEKCKKDLKVLKVEFDENEKLSIKEAKSYGNLSQSFDKNIDSVIDEIKNKRVKDKVFAKIKNKKLLKTSYSYADMDPKYLFTLIDELNKTKISKYLIHVNPTFGENISDAIAIEYLRIKEYVQKNKDLLESKVKGQLSKSQTKVLNYMKDNIIPKLLEITSNVKDFIREEVKKEASYQQEWRIN